MTAFAIPSTFSTQWKSLFPFLMFFVAEGMAWCPCALGLEWERLQFSSTLDRDESPRAKSQDAMTRKETNSHQLFLIKLLEH